MVRFAPFPPHGSTGARSSAQVTASLDETATHAVALHMSVAKLEDSMGQRSNLSNLSVIRNRSNSYENSCTFARMHQKFRKSRIVHHFLEYSAIFGEILKKFHQTRCKFEWNVLKNSDLQFAQKCEQKCEEKFDEFLLKFCDLSGAKDCKSCRSRKMLKNEYLVAKIGFDTAENEPSKVWRFGSD